MATFTRDAIKASFVKLLEERPLNRISVKDIVTACGVNRNTFYYYFQDIPTLVEELIQDNAERIIQKYPRVESIEQCLDAAIELAMSHRRAILHIYNSTDRATYERYLWHVCESVVSRYVDSLLEGQQPLPEEDHAILVRYLACTTFGIAMNWLEHGMQSDLRQLFHRFFALREDFAEELVRRMKATLVTGETPSQEAEFQEAKSQEAKSQETNE